MRDAVLLVDVLNDFRHADGERLLASFRQRGERLEAFVAAARRAGTAIVYANDNFGTWDGDGRALVERALDGPGGRVIERFAPKRGDALVLKPRYSAFDHTPLELVLGDLGAERLLMAGAATEMCVAQTAIDGREIGFKISVVEDACASVDPEMERVALDYLERVVGVWRVRSSEIATELGRGAAASAPP